MTETRQTNAVERLRRKVHGEWPGIKQSRELAEKIRADLQGLLDGLIPADTSFVVFGSLGRDEWTPGSDLDWTLLIDGQADPEHLNVSQRIRAVLDGKFKQPGRTGTFGDVAFSHEIIHQIGGQADTNRNTTQRILLLLESRPIGDAAAYYRVINGLLSRYVSEDTSFLTQDGRAHKVPRFLLNDIVRFWRTMAVDFASKQRERAGEGFGLRNIKLRFSRKLIFAGGLLVCFSCHPNLCPELKDVFSRDDDRADRLVNHLKRYVEVTPLEILAQALLTCGESDQTATQLFHSYDTFLDRLHREDVRVHLENLKSNEAREDEVFSEMRTSSHEFQAGLSAFFFENHILRPLILKYGVF